MLSQVFEIVSPLLIIALVGYVYGTRVNPEMQFTNRLIMDVFMPALILQVMLTEGFNVVDYSALIGAGFILMLGSGLVALICARLIGFDWRTVTPPAMFSNWANLGLPLYVAALGAEALNGGVMLVVAGNILCFTLGVYIYSGSIKVSEIFKTPIIIAVIIGLSLSYTDTSIPSFIDKPLDMLGQVVIPLMLFSLGVRLTKVSLNDSALGLVVGIFCPVVGVAIALGLIQLIPMSEMHQATLILFGVLPPAVINFMLAEQYNRNPEQVASIVMIGNLFGLVSIPAVLLWFIL